MDMDNQVSPPICTKTLKHLIPAGISLQASKTHAFLGGCMISETLNNAAPEIKAGLQKGRFFVEVLERQII